MAIRITPKTRLSDHPGGFISVGCTRCFHERELSADAMAHLIGWETRIALAIPRMRCSACGARSAHVSIFYPRRPRGWVKNLS